MTYRADADPVEVEQDLEELVDLQDLVERGPDWDTIVDIRVTRLAPSQPKLTVEEAVRQ